MFQAFGKGRKPMRPKPAKPRSAGDRPPARRAASPREGAVNDNNAGGVPRAAARSDDAIAREIERLIAKAEGANRHALAYLLDIALGEARDLGGER